MSENGRKRKGISKIRPIRCRDISTGWVWRSCTEKRQYQVKMAISKINPIKLYLKSTMVSSKTISGKATASKFHSHFKTIKLKINRSK